MEKKIKIVDMGIDSLGTLGVKAISVVEQPAINVDFVALNEQKPQFVKLQADSKHLLCGALLIPDQLIFRRDDKTNEEFYIRYSSQVIEQVAHNYLKQGKQSNATLEHTDKIEGLTLVESWITCANDKSKDYGFDLPVGTWFGVIKCDNEDVWNQVEQGKVKGFSIEGLFSPVKSQLMSSQLNEEEQLFSDLDALIKEFNAN